MAATWSFFLCDAAGSALAELTTASGKSIAFRRNSFAEAQFTISHEDEAASLLLNALANTGIPTLRCYRKGPNDTAGVLRFCGYLAPFNETSEEQSTLTAVFRSPLAQLLGDGSARGRFTAASVSFSLTDAGQIAKQLIDTTNADAFTGLATTGAIAVTKNRDRTYLFANVGEAITNLSNVLDGFDMYEDFTVAAGTTLAQLVIVASQGQDQPNARFEYGPNTLSNLRGMQRTTQPPINRAVVLGASGLTATKQDATSIAKYGLWQTQQSLTDVSEQPTLDDQAQALLRPNPVKTIQFTPELGLDSCPKPWDDFWLGDTVRLYASRGALVENTTVRVNAITVAIDDNGTETVAVADPSMPGDVDVDHAALSDPFVTPTAVTVEVV